MELSHTFAGRPIMPEESLPVRPETLLLGAMSVWSKSGDMMRFSILVPVPTWWCDECTGEAHRGGYG
jgi:hypothetical protein